jgi:hypothetical protein
VIEKQLWGARSGVVAGEQQPHRGGVSQRVHRDVLARE